MLLMPVVTRLAYTLGGGQIAKLVTEITRRQVRYIALHAYVTISSLQRPSSVVKMNNLTLITLKESTMVGAIKLCSKGRLTAA